LIVILIMVSGTNEKLASGDLFVLRNDSEVWSRTRETISLIYSRFLVRKTLLELFPVESLSSLTGCCEIRLLNPSIVAGKSLEVLLH